ILRKILIAYYSHSANTKRLAKLISNKVNGELFKIEAENAYPVNYNEVVERAKKEIKEGYNPDLKIQVKNIEQYDTIFIGTPNWWNSIAPPVVTFLKSIDFDEKKVIPFCTHGGGGFGSIEAQMKKLCKNATVLEGFAAYGGTSNELQLEEWLKKVD
ncbi:NAD(P)H-dependent oxidoreductase, partial [Clostridium felsineum]|uniref:flavodoxin n=1 Tax=Clostridium felsineum TaxID=36839 RepID=UPI00214DDD17